MSLIANYAFDSNDYNSGNGTTITDNSGNGNTLTKTGSGGNWDTDDPLLSNDAIKLIILYKYIFLIIIIINIMFERVIIWGHKLHTHTHSYIHYGFQRRFKHLNYDVYWFDNNDTTNDDLKILILIIVYL